MVRRALTVLATMAWASTSVVPPHTQVSDDEPALSEDASRMHERLVALSEGGGAIESLRIEFMDGNMGAHRSFNVEAGRLTTKEWKAPGAPMIHRRGDVSDERLVEMLRMLIEQRYWSFRGTRFVPDAPMFLFRFYYGELEPVDFRCDAAEYQSSPARSRIRDTFLELVSQTELHLVEQD